MATTGKSFAMGQFGGWQVRARPCSHGRTAQVAGTTPLTARRSARLTRQLVGLPPCPVRARSRPRPGSSRGGVRAQDPRFLGSAETHAAPRAGWIRVVQGRRRWGWGCPHAAEECTACLTAMVSRLWRVSLRSGRRITSPLTRSFLRRPRTAGQSSSQGSRADGSSDVSRAHSRPGRDAVDLAVETAWCP